MCANPRLHNGVLSDVPAAMKKGLLLVAPTGHCLFCHDEHQGVSCLQQAVSPEKTEPST